MRSSPVIDALSALDTALTDLTEADDTGELQRLDNDALLQVLQSVEALRHRLAVLDHHHVLELDRRALAPAMAMRLRLTSSPPP